MARKISAGVAILVLAASLVWARCGGCPVLPEPAQPVSSGHDCCDPKKTHDCGDPAPSPKQQCPNDRSLPDTLKADAAPVLDAPAADQIAVAAVPAGVPEPAFGAVDPVLRLHSPPDLFLLNSVLLV